MPVSIHGKEYFTVAERVQTFLEKFPGYVITTNIERFEGDDCIIKATILNDKGDVAATGIAHEVRGSTNINRTSHVENCETSAIGRALAALGLAGTEYASADEVANAISNQAIEKATERLRLHNKVLHDHLLEVCAIKTHMILDGGLETAASTWFQFDDEVKAALWIAPRDGGIFTTAEREIMKSKEFKDAYYQGELV